MSIPRSSTFDDEARVSALPVKGGGVALIFSDDEPDSMSITLTPALARRVGVLIGEVVRDPECDHGDLYWSEDERGFVCRDCGAVGFDPGPEVEARFAAEAIEPDAVVYPGTDDDDFRDRAEEAYNGDPSNFV